MGETFKYIRRNWLVVITGIITVFALQGTYLNHFLGLSFSKLATIGAVFGSLLILFAFITVQIIVFYTPPKQRRALIFVEAFIIACIHIFLARYIVLNFVDFTPEQLTNFSVILPHQIMMSFLIIASASFVSLRKKDSTVTVESEMRESSANEILREAELNKLQQQLQPHFLFNSLNSINVLIINRPDEAREMIQKLSDFLRATLKRSNEQWVLLKDEIEYLNLYLDIEKVRFGHRLDIKLDIAQEVLDQKIPTLLLQPIVENAIKFGLYGTTQKVVIEFRAVLEKELIKIIISNPFDREMLPEKGTGFGLNGIKRRLYLLYARNDLLETTSTQENIFITTLKTPVKHD